VGTGCSVPSWIAGKVGNSALNENPLSSQVSFVNASSINNPAVVGDALTVSLWINPSSSQVGTGELIRNGTGGDENYGFNLGNPSGGNYEIRLEGYNGTFVKATTVGYFIPANLWSQVVLIFTQGQNFQVYLNGIFQEAVSFPYITNLSTSNLNVGGNGGSVSQGYNGSFDDVRIYNRALSASEIQAIYNAEK
jgi:hypothetical protein